MMSGKVPFVGLTTSNSWTALIQTDRFTGLVLCCEALKHRDASLQTGTCTRCTLETTITQSSQTFLKWVAGSSTAAMQGHFLLYHLFATLVVLQSYPFAEHWLSNACNLFDCCATMLLVATAVAERMPAVVIRQRAATAIPILWCQRPGKFGPGAVPDEHYARTGADMIWLPGVVALLLCSLYVQVFGSDLLECNLRLTGSEHVDKDMPDLTTSKLSFVHGLVCHALLPVRAQNPKAMLWTFAACPSWIISYSFSSERPT